MKTTVEMNEQMRQEFLDYANRIPTTSKVFPERFYEIMEKNIGVHSTMCQAGKDAEGLERRNPLVVVLGDSVTAGHFEMTVNALKMWKGLPVSEEEKNYPLEITDVMESYPERFKRKLVQLYESTSVNVLNAGIAGDTIIGMNERLDRDVLSMKPDLVIINGTLNWNAALGTTEKFYETLKTVVYRIKEKTSAEIVLLTPNMDAGEKLAQFTGEPNTLAERVELVRRTAEEENVCLADVYHIWEGFAALGHEVSRMLANGFNHPTATGHEVYALELMKLFPKQVRDEAWKEAAVSADIIS